MQAGKERRRQVGRDGDVPEECARFIRICEMRGQMSCNDVGRCYRIVVQEKQDIAAAAFDRPVARSVLSGIFLPDELKVEAAFRRKTANDFRSLVGRPVVHNDYLEGVLRRGLPFQGLQTLQEGLRPVIRRDDNGKLVCGAVVCHISHLETRLSGALRDGLKDPRHVVRRRLPREAAGPIQTLVYALPAKDIVG